MLPLAGKGEVFDQKIRDFSHLPPVLLAIRVNICIGKGIIQLSYSGVGHYLLSCNEKAINEQ